MEQMKFKPLQTTMQEERISYEGKMEKDEMETRWIGADHV